MKLDYRAMKIFKLFNKIKMLERIYFEKIIYYLWNFTFCRKHLPCRRTFETANKISGLWLYVSRSRQIRKT